MKVKVYNDNAYEHREKFRGDLIVVPAGGSIEMNREDAVAFLGQFYPPEWDKGGRQKPESCKKLRWERIAINSDESQEELKCQACGVTAKDEVSLKSHVKAKHKHVMLDAESLEEKNVPKSNVEGRMAF